MFFRPRRRSHLRTVLLGVAAMGVLLWASVYRFNVPALVLWEYFSATLIVMGGVILLAGVAALLWLGGRRLLRRPQDG